MRVLLIEDDSATAQSIELMLKSEGFNVYTTDLGEGGVDLGKIYDYDLILLDLNLPDRDGFSVLVNLRSHHATISCVVLSASQDRDSIVKAMDLGVLGFIPKSSRSRLWAAPSSS